MSYCGHKFSFDEQAAKQSVSEWLQTGVIKLKNLDSVSFVKVEFLYVPYGIVKVDIEAEWTADIGVLDRGPYEAAMNQYRMQMNEFEAEVALTEPAPFSGPRNPKEPKQSDFVHWHSDSGTYSDTWNSGIIRLYDADLAGISKRTAKAADKILANSDHDPDLEANEIEELIASNKDIRALDRMEADTVFSQWLKNVEKLIKKNLPKQMKGDTFKSLSYTVVSPDSPSYDFQILGDTSFPMALVTYQHKSKEYTCVVDGRDVSNIKGQKAAPGVGELFGGLKKLFSGLTGKLPGLPKFGSGKSDDASPAASAPVSSRSKSKHLAATLAIVLGGLGAHKFYLGSWGWGCAYILMSITMFLLPLSILLSWFEGARYFLMDNAKFSDRYRGHPASTAETQ